MALKFQDTDTWQEAVQRCGYPGAVEAIVQQDRTEIVSTCCSRSRFDMSLNNT